MSSLLPTPRTSDMVWAPRLSDEVATSIWQGAIFQVKDRSRQKTVCMAVRPGFALQMGDGCELDVQSAAAFAQRNEELSYWQLQVWPGMVLCMILLPMRTSVSHACVKVCVFPNSHLVFKCWCPHQRHVWCAGQGSVTGTDSVWLLCGARLVICAHRLCNQPRGQCSTLHKEVCRHEAPSGAHQPDAVEMSR